MEISARTGLTPAAVLTTLPSDTKMASHKIQVGQIWKNTSTGETYLVTKLYNEALSTIAMLRPTGAATESYMRVRVERQGERQGLPGFSMAQDDDA
jgi:hypothetical protein